MKAALSCSASLWVFMPYPSFGWSRLCVRLPMQCRLDFSWGLVSLTQNHHLSRRRCHPSGPPTSAQAVDDRLRDWLELDNGSRYT